MKQPAFGVGENDSLQYHFFCENRFFAARILRSVSLDHSSVWVYDGGARELANSTERLIQTASDFLEVANRQVEISAPGAGTIALRGGDLRIDFEPRTEITWEFPSGVPGTQSEIVIHQPDLTCRVTYRGERLQGVGYGKRYTIARAPRYMGYVFIHAVSDDGSLELWTADGGWGQSKYDYFKWIDAGGALTQAESTHCYHQWSAAYAYIDGRRHEVRLEDIGRWETSLLTPRMDSLLGQRYCRMTFSDGRRTLSGVAVKEYWLGTLG